MNNGFNQNGQFGGWASSPYGSGAEMYNEQYLKYVQKEKEKDTLKKISSRSFFMVILYVLISYALSFAVLFISWVFPSISKIYNETLPSLAFDIIITFLAIGVPFFILHRIFKKEKISNDLPFGTTYNRDVAKYLVMVFLPLMVLSAIVINYVSAFFQQIFGIEFTSSVSEITLAGGKETLLGFLSIAVIPALIEETVIRGIVMQPLRKYGDKFAIIASSLLFAIMHGNMVQIPYTVIGGILLGSLAIITGSLWPSVILHFINNLYSVIALSVNDNFGETASLIATAIMLVTFAIVGAIGVVKLVKMKPHISLSNGSSILNASEKASAALKNGPAVVALVILVLVTLSNINF